MSEGQVKTTVIDGVGHIEFSHPKANSLPAKLLLDIRDEVDSFSQNAEVSVILLSSEGEKTFCAGASFEEFTALKSLDEAIDYFMGFGRVMLAMKNSPKLIVTKVQGKGVGGAIGLIASSDYVLAHNTATIRLSELALGIGPFVISEPIIRKIGVQHFTSLTIDTAWRPASWCEDVGLYSKVYASSEDLEQGVSQLLSSLSDGHQPAQSQLKEIFWRNTDDWPAIFQECAERSAKLLLTDWVQEKLSSL